MKRLLALLCLSLSFPLSAQPSKYSLVGQVRPGFGTPLSAEATVNLLGDTYYATNATTFGRIAGNTTAVKNFWCQTGTGSVSAAPAWCLLASGDIPANAANTTGSAAKWTTARLLAGNSVDGSANVAFSNKFLVQGTTDAGLTGAQFMGALGTGIVKNTVTTGVQSIAIAADFPTLNQSTTGSAATLTTPRAINGVNFDGSTPITVTADSNTLSGTTLKNTVINSSLTSVGALGFLQFGTHLQFSIANNANNEEMYGTIAYTSDLANKSGIYVYPSANVSTGKTVTSFSAIEIAGGAMSNVGAGAITNAYGLKISAPPVIGTFNYALYAAGILGIGNGTAPSTSPADMVQLWAEDVAASSELRVRDEAGNVTTLSPHNFSLFSPDASQIIPWSYYSRNAFIGKEVNVDIYGAVAAIEKLTGKKFIYTADLPPGDIEDWTMQEAAKKVHVEKQRLDKAMEKEIEVVVADAVEVVTITMSQPSATLTETVTKYVLDAQSGKVEAKTVTTPKMETIGTPKTESRLKAGVRLDETTGKFWRHVRADEAVVEPYAVKAPPAWMAGRMKAAR